MKPDTAEVLQIDLNKKNLLVIKFPEMDLSYGDIGLKMDIRAKNFEMMTEGLQDWIADKDKPFLCLGLHAGEIVTLEKIDPDANTDDLSEIANRIERLEEKVERIMKYMARG